MRRRSAGAGHTARTLHADTARTACIEIVVLAGSTRRFLAEIAQVIDELQGYVPANREVGTVLDVRALHRTAETRILVEQVVHPDAYLAKLTAENFLAYIKVAKHILFVRANMK